MSYNLNMKIKGLNCDRCSNQKEYTDFQIFNFVAQLLLKGLRVNGWKVMGDEILCKDCYDNVK